MNKNIYRKIRPTNETNINYTGGSSDTILFEKEFTIDGNKMKNFTDYISNIIDSIGLDQAQKKIIIDSFDLLFQSGKVGIIHDKKLIEKIMDLINHDIEIKEFMKTQDYSDYDDTNKTNFMEIQMKLAKLQGLIILRKIELPSTIHKILDKKLKSVLDILNLEGENKDNLPVASTYFNDELIPVSKGGGSYLNDMKEEISNIKKYFKYKSKYLNLKMNKL